MWNASCSFLLKILVLWSTSKISKTLPTVFAGDDSTHIIDPYADQSTPLRESMRGRHTGVTLKVLSLDFTENFMVEKFDNFEKLTGVTIEPVRVSQTAWYDSVLEDIKQDNRFIDLYGTFGNWVPEFASLGGLKDISEEVLENSIGLDWLDIMPAVRLGAASYKKSIYAVPLDGDVIYMLYRKDLVEDKGLPSPRSWDDVKEILEYYEKNTIYDKNGYPVYGNCFSTKENDIANHMFWSIASSYLQTAGTAQGVFFDSETFDPVSTKPEFLDVLNEYDYLVKHSPFQNNTEKGVDWIYSRQLFNEGGCVLFYNFPGPIKSMIYEQEQNGFAGNLNLAPLPGKKCTEDESCPYVSEDGVNHAPFLAGGGFAYAVNSKVSKAKQDAALDFALYLSDPSVSFWDVANPFSFLDPLRLRHTTSLGNNSTKEAQAFMDFGWEARQLSQLKKTTEASFKSKNYVLDLRNLGAGEYLQSGTVPFLIKMWQNKTTAKETADSITQRWDLITEKYGLTQQRDFYRDVLGLPPYVENDDELKAAAQRLIRLRNIILSVTIPIGVLAIILGIIVAKQRHTIKYHTRDVENAPKSGPIALVFTDIEDSTALWETNKHAMQKSLDIHHNVIRSLIDKYEAYEVKTVGDSFMIATNSADKAVMLANDIQEHLIHQDWPLELATMPASCVSYFPRPRRVSSESEPRLMFKGLRVRIGIHIGHYELGQAEDGEIQVLHDKVVKGFDYYGPVVNTAARIEDAAFGGQTMISKDVFEELSLEVKTACSINEIGNLNLRGVKDQVFVHSVLPESLKGRRFHGVFRRKSSGDSITSFANDKLSFKNVDIMTLTPVELQRGMKQMQIMIRVLEEKVKDYEEKETSTQEVGKDVNQSFLSIESDDDISYGGIDNGDEMEVKPLVKFDMDLS